MIKSERLLWPDVARGVAILLVVLHHTIRWLLSQDLAPDYWSQATEFLRTLRMPLFFGVAGMFAAPWVFRRSWQQLASRKVAFLMWVYLLWCVIRWVYFLVAPRLGTPEPFHFTRLLAAPLWPTNELWFLFALCVFFLIAKAAVRLPVWLHVSIAMISSICAFAGLLEVPTEAYDGILSYYLFFLIGCLFREQILAGIPKLSPPAALAIVTVWAGCYVALKITNTYEVIGIQVAIRMLGAISGLLIAYYLSRFVIGHWLGWVGQNTLPIYVSHVLWIVPCVYLLAQWNIRANPVFAFLIPWLVSVVSVSVGLAVWFVARRLGARWLYAPPNWVTEGVDKSWSKALSRSESD
ncbi:acyltransferase family protein [Rhodococcus sp. NPDC047139]|uniref:acyltransferase family protein n=1 Tax=Rhodococcus sp. NPDC047139 TaxID=3155141 RepID=UPI003404F0DC